MIAKNRSEGRDTSCPRLSNRVPRPTEDVVAPRERSRSVDGGHPITLDVMVRLQAIALPEADGGFAVVIPALGCATQGDTIEEAQANAVEAAEGWLTSQHKRKTDEAIRATQG